jgi:SAM-dependent methyltransferase
VSSPSERMRRFWDERAREDAFYFVDNRIRYKDPDAAELFWELGRRDLDELLGSLDVELCADAVVVEIGCGVGRLTRVIAARAAHVKALDVSDQMLAIARRENDALENVDWILGDGVSLAGVADSSADTVVSHVVFQHIPEPAITLGYVREIGRVLRPGGIAAVQMSNNPDVHHWEFTWRDRVRQRLGRAPRGQGDAAWIGSAVDLADLRAAAADAGLEIEKLVNEGTQYMLVRMRRR